MDELIPFLQATGAATWAERLEQLQLDLSQLTDNYVLISSVPNVVIDSSSGTSDGKNPLHYGINALHHAISSFFPPKGASVGPVFVGAFSIGQAGDLWLGHFAQALHVKLNPESDLRFIMDENTTYFDPDLRLRKFGCIWRADKNAAPVNSHSKQILRAWTHPGCTKLHGWTYVGSHNVSKASWGTPEGQMNLWELGVLSFSTCELAHQPLKYQRQPSTCGGWSLSEVPFLFDVSKVIPLSWHHKLHVAHPKTGGGMVFRAFGIVLNQERTDKLKLRDPKRSREDSSSSIAVSVIPFGVAFLSQSVCPPSIPFPPSPNTAMLVRIKEEPSLQIVWVERVFHPSIDDPSSDSSPATKNEKVLIRRVSNDAAAASTTNSADSDARATVTSAESAPSSKYIPPHRRNNQLANNRSRLPRQK